MGELTGMSPLYRSGLVNQEAQEDPKHWGARTTGGGVRR